MKLFFQARPGYIRGGPVPLHHPDLPLVIYYSPKAGSTVITQIFFEAVGLIDEALAYSNFVHNYEHKVFKKREGYRDEVLAALARGVPCVKFIRDPLPRALSMYLELIRPEALTHPKPWFYGHRRQILKDVYGTDDPHHPFSFFDFLTWRAAQTNRYVNPHLKEQVRPPVDRHLKPRVVEVERMPEQLRDFPRLDAAYRAAAARGLLEAPHHKPKAEMSREEALAVLRDPHYAGRLPKLRLSDHPNGELYDLMCAAFPNDMKRIAPRYFAIVPA